MAGDSLYRKMVVSINSAKMDFSFCKSVTAMDEIDELRRMLEELRLEHRDLDDVIARLLEKAPYDQLQLQRLKKRKLVLKDTISRIENELRPDIIA